MHSLRAALLAGAGPEGEISQAVGSLLECLNDSVTDVHVCCVGGVGSSFLMAFLNRRGLTTNLQTDADGLRHCPRPPPTTTAGAIRRGVYLFGNPLDAVASHFARGHAAHQASKTSGREPPPGALCSLEAYVAGGCDHFGLEAHLHNWMTLPLPYDVMFVRYERMFEPEAARALLHFVYQDSMDAAAVDAALLPDFLAQRRARSTQLTDAQRQAMYSELQAKVDTMPAWFVRKADAGASGIQDVLGGLSL